MSGELGITLKIKTLRQKVDRGPGMGPISMDLSATLEYFWITVSIRSGSLPWMVKWE